MSFNLITEPAAHQRQFAHTLYTSISDVYCIQAICLCMGTHHRLQLTPSSTFIQESPIHSRRRLPPWSRPSAPSCSCMPVILVSSWTGCCRWDHTYLMLWRRVSMRRVRYAYNRLHLHCLSIWSRSLSLKLYWNVDFAQLASFEIRRPQSIQSILHSSIRL